jgi:hypothetical protein
VSQCFNARNQNKNPNQPENAHNQISQISSKVLTLGISDTNHINIEIKINVKI